MDHVHALLPGGAAAGLPVRALAARKAATAQNRRACIIATLAASLATLPIVPSPGVEGGRGRKSGATHPGAARGHRGRAVFSAFLHQPAAAGLVRAPTAAASRTGCSRFRMARRCWRCSATRCWWNRICPRACRPSHGRPPMSSSRYCAASPRGDRPARPWQPDPTHRAAGHPPPSIDRFLWLALSACGSVLLLAVTTHLTQDIAAIPFLWILPLSVYLLSFIICLNRRASTAASFSCRWWPLRWSSSPTSCGPTIWSPAPCRCRRLHRPLRRGAVHLLHGVPRRTGAHQAASALPHALLRGGLAGRRVRRPVRGIAGARHLSRL